jgi:ABC-type transporter Mla subunit MlaD
LDDWCNDRRKEHDVASLKDAESLADDLENLVGELRSELQKGDFERLAQLADEISEHADNAAETFSNVNETLMSRIGGLRSGRSAGQRPRGNNARAKSASS